MVPPGYRGPHSVGMPMPMPMQMQMQMPMGGMPGMPGDAVQPSQATRTTTDRHREEEQ